MNAFIRAAAQKTETVFRFKSREETCFASDGPGPELSRSRGLLEYRGGLEGEGALEELKIRFNIKRASTYALQRFTGRLGQLSGSFVLHGMGRRRGGFVSWKWVVAPGSGTDGLKGIRGEMQVSSQDGEEFSAVFRYSFV